MAEYSPHDTTPEVDTPPEHDEAPQMSPDELAHFEEDVIQGGDEPTAPTSVVPPPD